MTKKIFKKSDYQHIIDKANKNLDSIDVWERNFVANVNQFEMLSLKQSNILLRIDRKLIKAGIIDASTD